jgi:phosphorylated CTD-interacting factor 1
LFPQGAIHEKGFEVLKDFFPRVFECFGSPLNATLPCFASAFETLDWHFGSMGDLAHIPEFKDGCCGEANPPFTPGFMEFLAQWILQRIQHANDRQKSLSFVVIVPSVHEQDVTAHKKARVASAVKRFAAKAHQQMVDSPACSLFLVLPAKEHGYVEGAQHLRPTRYKKSLYDTSVILLQSHKAQSTEFDKHKFEAEIRSAFAERHSEESRKRAKTNQPVK